MASSTSSVMSSMTSMATKVATIALSTIDLHTNCRAPNPYSNKEETCPYPRLPVPDDQVLNPSVEFLAQYKQNVKSYTTKKVSESKLADKVDNRHSIVYNAITTHPTTGKQLDRRNWDLKTPYKVIDGHPINPQGLTGLEGKGRLFFEGPNPAADPILIRYKRQINSDGSRGKIIFRNHKAVLEIVLVKRVDTNDMALPGGMQESGDSPFETMRKEFGEEALASKEATPEQKEAIKQLLKTLFTNAKFIGRFYVDDPRNTDNAWMQSTVYCAIDKQGITYEYPLKAGDDASAVAWFEVYLDETGNVVIPGLKTKLYASHESFVKLGLEYVLANPITEMNCECMH